MKQAGVTEPGPGGAESENQETGSDIHVSDFERGDISVVTARALGMEETSAKLAEEEGELITVRDRWRRNVNMMILSTHILPCLSQCLEFVCNAIVH